MKKQVFIHIGYHKTGSSALQAAFALHADALRAIGVAYPWPDSAVTVAHGVCSGNVTRILLDRGYMRGYDPRAQKPHERLSPAYFRDLARIAEAEPEDRVLFSGEILGRLTAEQLAALQEAFSAHDLRIFCYVRDPFDFAYSCWKQTAKNGHQKNDLGTFVRNSEQYRHLSMLSSFPALEQSGLALTVLRYETHRRALAQSFLDAAGWQLEDGTAFAAPPNANPSLSGAEALIATLLRAASPATPLADLYVRHAQLNGQGGKADRFYDRALHREILDIFGPAIGMINRHLPEGEWLETRERDTADVPIEVSAADLRIMAEAMAHLAGLAARQAGPRRALQRLLNKIRWPGLSSRFDAQTYAFLYPDVAGSGMSPQQHYLRFGRAEGRRPLNLS